ncbi:MAG UNVERIFIED_CONTAM: cell wall metabolism sensor histidine kinase WalK [Anaerolineae bacterium]
MRQSRLTNMVQDLGYLSRLDAGRLELDSAEVNLNQIAQRLMRQFELLAREKNITLHFLSSEASVGVQASMDHLLIVFRNLLDNAIKYTPANGNVTWEMLVSEGRVINRIMDDGQGIEPDQLPHVFKRFYRGDKARSRHIVGYGLGLSLVKAIVEAYHAEITLASAGAGKGTTVTVIFPLAPSNQDDLSQS